MVLPPSAEATGPVLPREATFVVDTSGSMSGVSIVQAREATAFAISRLKPGDRFNVIEFNSRTRALFAAPMPVEPSTIAAARTFVANLRANGGTEMKPAPPESLPGLRARCLPHRRSGRQRERAPEAHPREPRRPAPLHDRDRPRAERVVHPQGRAVRSRHLDVHRRRRDVRGDDRAVRELNGPPSPISITSRSARVYPQQLPDLYWVSRSSSPRVAGAPTTLSIVGRRGTSAWGRCSRGQAPRRHRRLWARERISALSDAIVEGAPEDEVRPLIVATALEHHLVSKYTSLVAVDVTPIAPAGTAPLRTAIPGLLPAGIDPAGFVGGLPRTATPASCC
jgi:Ca-activated chloride channel family protein